MRESVLSYIGFLLALCILSGCSEKQINNWTPNLQNGDNPFSMGRLITLYSIQADCDDPKVSWPGYVILDVSQRPELLNDNNIAIISSSEITIRSRYIAGRIIRGYNTLIAAEIIKPVIGGELTFQPNGEYKDKPLDEIRQGSISDIKGTKFDFDSFLKQAEKQDFPQAEIETPLGGDSLSMPNILCSRYLEPERLLLNLGIPYIPKETEIIMTVDGNPVAIRYTFNNNSHLTVVSAPMLFSNYAISLENAKFAHKAMYILCLAFENNYNLNALEYNIDENGFTCKEYGCAHFILHGLSSNPKYDYKSTPKPQPISSDDYEVERWFLTELLKSLWPFLLLLIPILFYRRQRVINIHEGYKNRSAEYAKHVGSLYAQEGNLHGILNNTIAYFYYDIKRRYSVDLSDAGKIQGNASVLAAQWNQRQDEVSEFLSKLNKIRNATDALYVSPEELTSICEQINLYLKK